MKKAPIGRSKKDTVRPTGVPDNCRAINRLENPEDGPLNSLIDSPKDDLIVEVLGLENLHGRSEEVGEVSEVGGGEAQQADEVVIVEEDAQHHFVGVQEELPDDQVVIVGPVRFLEVVQGGHLLDEAHQGVQLLVGVLRPEFEDLVGLRRGLIIWGGRLRALNEENMLF